MAPCSFNYRTKSYTLLSSSGTLGLRPSSPSAYNVLKSIADSSSKKFIFALPTEEESLNLTI